MRIPRHLAIIMDGNGRWAQQRRLPRIAGHQRGVQTVQAIVEECRRLGVGYLTLYAFSSENWGRPQEEVHALMDLLGNYLQRELDTMLRHRVRLNVIGQTGKLPAGVRQILERTVERTAGNDGMVLTLALSYGARDEILRATRVLAGEAADGRLQPDQIDEQRFAGALDTAGLPDPDLLIRTSGEMRVSNFLLWQIAYAELYFSELLWPDFDCMELQRALEEFARRQRRFGLTGDQIDSSPPEPQETDH